MDKKNTMLLTVIAVATLLVAVVGATFAYFTISTVDTNATASTTTATTESLATLTLATTNSTLYLNTTANDFHETNSAISYWATTSAGRATTEPNPAHTIFTVSSSSDGGSDAVYECTFDFRVQTANLPAGRAASGEYKIYITGIGTATLDLGTTGVTDNSTDDKTYTATVYLAGPGQSATLNANIELINTASEQNAWKSQSVTTTFTPSNFACTSVASAGSNGIAVKTGS